MFTVVEEDDGKLFPRNFIRSTRAIDEQLYLDYGKYFNKKKGKVAKKGLKMILKVFLILFWIEQHLK